MTKCESKLSDSSKKYLVKETKQEADQINSHEDDWSVVTSKLKHSHLK